MENINNNYQNNNNNKAMENIPTGKSKWIRTGLRIFVYFLKCGCNMFSACCFFFF